MQVLGTLWLVHRPDSELIQSRRREAAWGPRPTQVLGLRGGRSTWPNCGSPQMCSPLSEPRARVQVQRPVLMAEPRQPGPP